MELKDVLGWKHKLLVWTRHYFDKKIYFYY